MLARDCRRRNRLPGRAGAFEFSPITTTVSFGKRGGSARAHEALPGVDSPVWRVETQWPRSDATTLERAKTEVALARRWSSRVRWTDYTVGNGRERFRQGLSRL